MNYALKVLGSDETMFYNILSRLELDCIDDAMKKMPRCMEKLEYV